MFLHMGSTYLGEVYLQRLRFAVYGNFGDHAIYGSFVVYWIFGV